jgi:Transposase DDE domain
MTIHPHENLLRAARAQARTDEFKQAYPTRSVIERIISWTATSNGRRIKLRYIGTAKNDAWLPNRCAAINLRTPDPARPDPLRSGLGPGLTIRA